MGGNSKARALALALAATALTAGVIAPSYSQDAGRPSTMSPETLKERFLDAIGSRIATATPEDIEGTIIFVINQGDYPDDTIEAALSSLLAMHGSANVLTAVASVRSALKKKRPGTAAIFDGGGGLEFSSPAGSGGGGGSNYTQI